MTVYGKLISSIDFSKYQLVPIQCPLLVCSIVMNNDLVVLSTWTMVGEAIAALRPPNMPRVQETLWLHIIIIVYYGGQVPKSKQLPYFCYVDFYILILFQF